MDIPRRLKLLGRTITVEYDPMLDGRDGTVGEARYTSDSIALQPNTDTFRRPQTQLEQVFLHELVHYILNEMNEYDLRRNEKFVDVFAGLLHQALTTMEFE
jgi:predicted SprT family Zn-dependent metalloprotease